MGSQGDREGQILDAVVDMSVEDGLPSIEDAREDLRAAGLSPGRVGRSLRERLIAATWKEEASVRRQRFAENQGQRRPRPSGMGRQEILALIKQHPAEAVAFRNADEMSEDDLWDLLCDLEMDDEG